MVVEDGREWECDWMLTYAGMFPPKRQTPTELSIRLVIHQRVIAVLFPKPYSLRGVVGVTATMTSSGIPVHSDIGASCFSRGSWRLGMHMLKAHAA